MDKNNEIWSGVLEYIQKNVTSTTYNTFIKAIELRQLQQNPHIAYLEKEKVQFLKLIKNRYLHLFEDGFKEITGENYRVILKASNEYEDNPTFLTLEPVTEFDKPVSMSNLDLNVNFRKEKIFNPLYTFDNFVVGDSNRLTYTLCEAVAKSPSEAYNPLFIYGKSGLGKTHLINSIGIYILEHDVDKRLLYVSSETFTNDFIKALQDKKTREFKNKYRKSDVLLIDDIQFLEGKETMQEEFFHTFNTLFNENKQIIISSDRPPNKLTRLDERLRSRFSWNMTTELLPPDYETRVAILLKKAENMKLEVDDDVYEVICFISEMLKDNIRELEGAFSRITGFSKLSGERITLEFAKRMLQDIIQNGGTSITPEIIKTTVCKHYKIKVSDLEAKTRAQKIAFPRQVAMYLTRELTDYSLPQIGKVFGNRHHSTVKHACDKIADDMKVDQELKITVDNLMENIKN